jgi:alginate O-acetyltransferase complex protein AlgI
LQLYFDFSGYSDMAIGLGRMLGFRFKENFRYPFSSRSITEFWTRWHISMTTWFRDYLYASLRGKAKSKIVGFINLLTVFILVGLWHGASWTFAAWGVLNGMMLVLERIGLEKFIRRLWIPFQHVYMLCFTVLHGTLFRSRSFEQYMEFLRAMFGFAGSGQTLFTVDMFLNGLVIMALIVGAIGSFPIWPGLSERYLNTFVHGQRKFNGAFAVLHDVTSVAAVIVLLFLSAAFMSGGTYSPFIYFRF